MQQIKGIVHPKIKTCWKFPHPQAIENVDEFVSSSEQIWEFCIASFAHQWMLSIISPCTFFSEKDQTSTHICLELFWTVFACKQCKSVHILFPNQTRQLHKVIDRLEWCGLLVDYCDCFYQLFGLSFWRHPFTAEDPLVSKWWNATFLQIWWSNKLIYILDGLRVSKCSANWINSNKFHK